MLIDTYMTYIVMKDNDVFVDFSDDGSVTTLNINDIKSIDDIWHDPNNERLEDMLIEFEKRFEGFHVVEIEVTTSIKVRKENGKVWQIHVQR